MTISAYLDDTGSSNPDRTGLIQRDDQIDCVALDGFLLKEEDMPDLRAQHSAFCVIYAMQLANHIWVVHALQKKSTTGSKTPPREIEVVRNRLKQLKEMLT